MKHSNVDYLFRDIGIILALTFIDGLIAGLFTGTRIFTFSFVFFLSLLVGIILILLWTLRDLLNRTKGVIGEYKIGVILNQLWPWGVRSINGVVLEKGKGDIDHIVIAESGIWVIENKYSGGKITESEAVLMKNDKPFKGKALSQAYAEACAVRNFLREKGTKNISIEPILVFSSPYAKVRCGFNKIKGVYVVGSHRLNDLILNSGKKAVLRSDEINRIHELFEDFYRSRASYASPKSKAKTPR